MNDKIKISQLQLEENINENSLIPIVQDNKTKAIKSKDLLKDLDGRIDSINSQLDNNIRVKNIGLIDGKLFLPEDFPRIPFDIYKNKSGFFCDLNSKKLTNKNAKKVYISCFKEGKGLGDEPKSAITLNRFNDNLKNNSYGEVSDVELIFIDKVYLGTGNDFLFENQAINITFRSGVGYTWLGRAKHYTKGNATKWQLENGIYKSTLDSSGEISDLVNLSKTNEFGMPYIYIKVNSLEECKLSEGTFFQDGNTIYHNPYNFHNPLSTLCVTNTLCLSIRQYNTRKCVIENIGFMCGSLRFATDNVLNQTYFINCRFHRGATNSFSAEGKYSVYLYNCVADYGSADNFNYHTFDNNSLVVEINCIAYKAGYNKITATATASNNCSTAHEGLNILRIGCQYWDSEGPIIADVNNCYSINISCSAKNCKESATGYKASYLFQNTSPGRDGITKKYLIDCFGGGEYIKYGIVGQNDTYINNFNGNVNFKNEESLNNKFNIVEWEGEING